MSKEIKKNELMSNPIIKMIIADFIAKAIIMHTSEIYCKIHRTILIHNRIIYNGKTPIEIGYCYKCQKEYCEYSDISPIYISNYEWLYDDYVNKTHEQKQKLNSLYGKFNKFGLT